MIDISKYSENEKYNLFKKLYEKKQVKWNTADKCVNLIGVRGLKNGRTVDFNANNVFNDTIVAVFIEDNQKRVLEFDASCEPGSNEVSEPSNKKGAAYLANGVHKFKVGWHNKKKKILSFYTDSDFPKNCYQCLEPDPTVKINRVIEKSSDNRISVDELTNETEENYTVQIHYGGEKDSTEYNRGTKSWSAGCQLIKGRENYTKFIQSISSDPSVKKIVFPADVKEYDFNKALTSGTERINYLLVDSENLEEIISGTLTFPLSFPPVNNGDSLFETVYRNNEFENKFGYFPIGRDMLWHGGMHLFASEHDPVYNVYDGEIIAAKFANENEIEYETFPQQSNGFVLLRHKAFLNNEEKIFFSLHIHMSDESICATDIPWIKRLPTNKKSMKISWKPKPSRGLILWDSDESSSSPRPACMGEESGLAQEKSRYIFIKEEFEEYARWDRGDGNIFVQLDYNGEKKWVCIKSNNQEYVTKVSETVDSGELQPKIQDLIEGKFVSFVDCDEIAPLLAVKAGEQIGRCGKIAVKKTDGVVYGEHFEIFSGDNLVSDDSVSSISELLQNGEDNNTYLILETNYGTFPDFYGKPDRSKGSFDRDKKAANGEPLPVLGLYEDDKNKFALVDVNSEKRWVTYEWPSGYSIRIDGKLIKNKEIKWVKIEDQRSEIKHNRESMDKMVDLVKQVDSNIDIPDNILKRQELSAFYSQNPNSSSLRYVYIDSLSEWSIDPESVFDEERSRYFSKEKRDLYKKEIERFRIWKNLPDLINIDGFAKKKEGEKIWHYRYHPVTFLEWFGKQIGASVKNPDGMEVKTVSSESSTRAFVFKEVNKIWTIQESIYEKRYYWDIGPAVNRWFYLFGRYSDGTTRVWEIKTDQSGKFQPIELIENSDNTRPDDTVYDAEFPVDRNDTQGNTIQYFIMISEIRLSKDRVFKPNEGLINDPSVRCADVDDPQITCKKHSASDDTEIVGVVNYFKEAKRRNREYQNALNEYYASRYNFTVNGKFDIDDFNWESDSTVNREFTVKSDDKEKRIAQITDAFILSFITKEKKKVGKYSDGTDKEEIIYNPKMLMNLDKGGKSFKYHVQNKISNELNKQMVMRDKISFLSEIIKTRAFNETLVDYTLADNEKEWERQNELVQKEYYEVIDRLDECKTGRDIILKMREDDSAIIGENNGLLNTEAIVDKVNVLTNENIKTSHKVTKSTFAIVDSVCKVVVEKIDSDFAKKEKEIKSILKRAVNLDIRIADKISSANRDARVTFPELSPELNFKRYEIDPYLMGKYNHYQNIDAEIGKIGFVLDLLSLSMNYNDLKERGDIRSYYDAANSIINLASWICRETKSGQKFAKIAKVNVKKINYATAMITGSIDTVLSGVDAYNEFHEADRDAGWFKITECLGSACLSASGFCLLTGAGTPLGLLMGVAGTSLVVVGGIGHELTDDTPISIFLKNSPWGKKKRYNQSYEEMREAVYKIFSFLYDFDAEASFNSGKMELKIFPKIFDAKMKIRIYRIVNGMEEDFELNSNNLKIKRNSKGKRFILYTGKVDTSGNLYIQIDTYGDGQFILPEKDRSRKIKFPNFMEMDIKGV